MSPSALLSYLRQLVEYTAYVVAPLIDTRLDLFATLALAALLLLLFAALVAMPRRVRIGFVVPAAVSLRRHRMPRSRPPLRNRRVRAPSQPRAPALAL